MTDEEWDDEYWKEIKGFPGYWVSNHGQIGSRKIDTNGVILRSRPSGWGYLQVVLWRGGKQHTKSVHLLVAEHFVPGQDATLEPNHIDGNKENNHDTNLEWVTKRENNEHAVRIGLRIPHRKTVGIVGDDVTYPSVAALAEHLQTWPTVISEVLTRRRPHYKGMTFEYRSTDSARSPAGSPP